MDAKDIDRNKYHHAKVKAIIVFSMLALALATVLNILYQCSNNIEKNTLKMYTAYNNKIALTEIQKIVTDLETGARGYAITGDEKYLEQSNKSIGSIYNQFNILKNNSRSHQTDLMISKLNNLVDKKIDNSTRTIELRRNKNAAAAMQNIQQGDGKLFMDSIRLVVKTALVAQSKLISDDHKTEYELNNFYEQLFLLFAALLLVCSVVVFFIMRSIFLMLHTATDELLQSNNFLNSLLENMPNMVFVKDAKDLRFVRFNKAGEKLLGYSRQALIGKNDYDFFPKEQADFFVAKDREAIKTESAVDIKEEIVDTAHGKRWLRTKKIILKDEHKKPAYLLGISEDITDQKLIDEKEKQYAYEIISLFNNAPCGYISTDINGKIIEINDTFLKWLGYSRNEILNQMETRSLVMESYYDVFNYYYIRFRSGEIKSIVDLELQFKRKDGSAFFTRINIVAEYDHEGNFLKTKASMFDVTQYKKEQLNITKN